MVSRMIGNRQVTDYSEEDVADLKTAMLARGHGVCRQVSILLGDEALPRVLFEVRLWRVAGGSITVPKRPASGSDLISRLKKCKDSWR